MDRPNQSTETFDPLSKSYWEKFIQYTGVQYLLIGIFILSILNFFYNSILPILPVDLVDFQVYYDYSNLMDVKYFDRDEPWFVYLPIWGILFKPFLLFSFETAQKIWILLNILFIFLFIYLSVKWCRKVVVPIYPLLYTVLISYIVLNFSPVLLTFRYGQINIVILLLLMLSFYFYWVEKPFLTAFFLALAITTRYIPAILLIYFFWKKEYKIIWMTLITMAIFLVISLLTAGIQMHLDYLILMNNFARYVKENYDYFGNFSFYSLLCHLRESGWLPASFPAYSIHLIFAFCLIALASWVTRLNSPKNKLLHALEFGLWCTMLPLVSYYGESHHFIFPLISFVISIGAFRLIPGIVPKIFLFLSWLLIYITHPIRDLSMFGGHTFWFNYLSLLGTLLIYVTLIQSIRRYKRTNAEPRVV